MKPQTEPTPSLRVEASSFGMNDQVPIQHTADGDDVAPSLSWSKPPEGTKSIAIIVEDPDAPDPNAPTRTWTHWIVTGIPADVTELDGDRLPPGAVMGRNDWGNHAWGGPNPPIGRHRYFFKVYALDIALHAPNAMRDAFHASIKGHILAQGELIGTYEKPHERRSLEKSGSERRPSSHR